MSDNRTLKTAFSNGLPLYKHKHILSIVTGTLLSVTLLWTYGYLLVLDKKSYLTDKATFIEQLGGIALPSTQSLSSFSSGFLFGSGAFFGLSLGLFFGIIISCLIILTKKPGRRVTRGMLVSIGILLCYRIGKNFFPFITLPVFMILPFTIYSGHLLSSFLIQRYFSSLPQCKHLYTISVLIFISVFSLLFFSTHKKKPDYIAIRDSLLLTNPVGNAINSFYYTRSPFAAETIKPLQGKRQLTVLYIGNEQSTIRFFQRYHAKKMWLFVKTTDSQEEAATAMSSGGIDIIIVDEQQKNIYDSLSKKYAISSFSLFAVQEQRSDITAEKVEIPTIILPVSIKKIQEAVNQLSNTLDTAKGFRVLIKYALFDYVWIVVCVVSFLCILFFVSLFSIIIKALLTFSSPKGAVAVFGVTLLLVLYPAGKKLTERSKTTLQGQPIDTLLEYLNSKENTLRYQASVQLAKISKKNRDEKISKAFMKVLDDSDPRVRLYAAIGLGNLKYQHAVPKLIDMLEDPQINVRYKSADALGKIGDPAAIEPLTTLIIENSIWYVSDYALKALRKIRK